jgi:hypothetical protein
MAVAAALVLPAASVAVTDRVYEPSRPAPLRSTVVVDPQVTADAGTDVAPVTEQLKVTPASVSVTENCGWVTSPGEEVGTARVTVGTAGAIVSSTYVEVPAVLMLPATSVAVTDNVYEPSRPAPLRSTVVVGPQLTADAGTEVGPVTEQVRVTPDSASVTEKEGLAAELGDDAGDVSTTLGAGGGVVSSV